MGSDRPTSDMGTVPASHAAKPAWDGQALQGDPHRRDDKAQRVQAMFTAIAHAYDINNRLHSLGLDQSWRRRTVRLVEPIVGSRVLDVACGTGDLTEAFARAGATEVTGLDYTAAMLDHARVKAAKAGGAVGRIHYLQGDAQSLPFPDASFDIVSIAFGIRNVADPAKAIAEFRRVLAPVVVWPSSSSAAQRLDLFGLSAISTRSGSCHGRPVSSLGMGRVRTTTSRSLSKHFSIRPRSRFNFVLRDSSMSRRIP